MTAPRLVLRFLVTCVLLAALAPAPPLLAGETGSLPGPSAQAPPAASLDDILKKVAAYNGGIDSAALWELRDYVRARKDDPAARTACETALLRFLTSPATPAAKVAVGRHLRLIAGDSAVPALQAMVADPALADVALYALQGIAGATAERALLDLLARSTGTTKIGVIAALGERRTDAAVPALIPLLTQPALRGPVATALGRIGSESAAAALLAAYASVPADTKTAVASAMLEAGDRLLAAKSPFAARRLYDTVLGDAALPVPLRSSALRGVLSLSGNTASALMLDMLTGPDVEKHEAVMGHVARVFPPAAIDPVCAALPGLPAASQIQLLAVLSRYPGDRVRPAVLRAAGHEAVAVRVAALKALESVGDPTTVALLAQRAASTSGPEQAAARAALGAMPGRPVDDAIVALLGQSPPDDVAAELLAAIADRRIYTAKPAVTARLSAPAAPVRTQALRTLRSIGTPSDASAVMDLLLSSRDDTERGEAEKTLGALFQKLANSGRRARPVMMRLMSETGAEARARLLGVLPLTGDDSALPAVRAALADQRPAVVDAAVRALTAWPSSAARDDVAHVAKTAADETHRLLAITAFVRLVAADPHRRPEAAVSDLKAASALASRPEEKRLVLGALGAFPCRAALDLAREMAADPAVAAEAKAAIDTITQRMPK